MHFFITGTDTNVGKTYVTSLLLKAYKQLGYTVIGIKPLASGGDDDVKELRLASSPQFEEAYTSIIFDEPIAPHLAANKNNISLTAKQLINNLQKTFELPAEVFLIEGAGGWFVPLNEKETMADMVIALNIPVILVVDIKLGCINHALLTINAIKQSGVSLAGWIANCKSKYDLSKEVILTLQHFITAPLMTTVLHGSSTILNCELTAHHR